MKITFRGRIKDLMVREGPNGLPQMSQKEAEEYYNKGYNRNSIVAIEKEFEDIKEPQPKEDKKKVRTEDLMMR